MDKRKVSSRSGPMSHRLYHLGRAALVLPEDDPVRRLGLSWYDSARRWCQSLADRWAQYGATLESVAGAVAALSPQCSWTDQTRFLPGFLESVLVDRDERTLPHPGFLVNRARAARILQGADPSRTLSGPKVTAFYRAIVGDCSAVVVDRHAATLALGFRKHNLTAALVRDISRAYELAARRLGIAPRDLQSLIWCVHKATGAAARDEQATFFEGGGQVSVLAELGLGWSDDPFRAFEAPADVLPETLPEPDSSAPVPELVAETAAPPAREEALPF